MKALPAYLPACLPACLILACLIAFGAAAPACAKPHKAKPAAPQSESLARTGTGEADYPADDLGAGQGTSGMDASGMGEADYGAAPALPPLPARTVDVPAAPPAAAPVAAEYSERNFTYVPPQSAGQAGGIGIDAERAATPAETAARVMDNDGGGKLLKAGTSFGGLTMAAPAQPFETGIALDQQGFAELWQRIGQPAPAAKLGSGMGAVFASNGPQVTSGYDVRLRTLNQDRDAGPLLVEATFIQPSPKVAIAPASICPWRILIVPASDIKLVSRRSYAGGTTR